MAQFVNGERIAAQVNAQIDRLKERVDKWRRAQVQCTREGPVGNIVVIDRDEFGALQTLIDATNEEISALEKTVKTLVS